MKTKLLITIPIALALCACPQGSTINDAFITATVAAGTSAGLKLAVTDTAKQKVIAQYLDTYASALRTITGDPTDEQLTQQLMAFVPPDINAQYPEIAAFAVPLVVSSYDWAKAKYGADSKTTVEILNAVAAGIETGASSFLH